MDHTVAAEVMCMRPAMEALIVKATKEPETLSEPSEQDSALMAVMRELSKPRAARFGIHDDTEGMQG